MAEIKQTIIDGVDRVISEHNNTYVSLRKCTWKDGAEPKWDLRKYCTRNDGTEQIMKGCSFDDEGADELTKVLLEEGRGNTRECLEAIKDRKDFMPALTSVLSNDNRDVLEKAFPDMDFSSEEVTDESYYDIREELG